MRLKFSGNSYESVPAESHSCTGCAFKDDLGGCHHANRGTHCNANRIIWIRKESKEEQPVLSFEQKLHELLMEELKINNRKVVSIYARNHLADGAPSTFDIHYEHTA